VRERRRVARGADTLSDGHEARLAEDVAYYLTQQPRQLPSWALYDQLGSALFEAICHLPWYRVRRAELALLAAHGSEILDACPSVIELVELGPGSGEKLQKLVEVGWARPSLRIHLVDVSSGALDHAERRLSTLPDVQVVRHQASYEDGVASIGRGGRGAGAILVLFLGSNIGNFDRPATEAFLRSVRRALLPGDAFLVGADLIKPERDLLLAYDDPLGVTAAFNLNLLYRLNRELGGDFAIERFFHRARWNEEHSRVEMHLVSRAAQRVRLPAAALDFELAEGETIWTESSYKFRPGDLASHLDGTGFTVVRQWINAADRFALTLARAV
jgi:L-histidine N-alpha-methyltransferase